MQFSAPDALDRARRIRLMIFDVDGVLTDGRLWFGAGGEELKAFHSFDGHGMKMLAASGSCARCCRAALRCSRARCSDSASGTCSRCRGEAPAFEKLVATLGFASDVCGFMGDELVDLPVLTRCGFACAPREAPEPVRRRVHYVASTPAGYGAAREVCEFVMRAQGTLEGALQAYIA